jgi:hypothetical protein
MAPPADPVHVETLLAPHKYAWAQIQQACAVAQQINRGRFVLVEKPWRQ